MSTGFHINFVRNQIISQVTCREVPYFETRAFQFHTDPTLLYIAVSDFSTVDYEFFIKSARFFLLLCLYSRENATNFIRCAIKRQRRASRSPSMGNEERALPPLRYLRASGQPDQSYRQGAISSASILPAFYHAKAASVQRRVSRTSFSSSQAVASMASRRGRPLRMAS